MIQSWIYFFSLNELMNKSEIWWQFSPTPLQLHTLTPLPVFTLVFAFFHFFICMPLHSLSESPSHATALLRGSSSFPLWNSFHTQWLPRNVNEAAASGRFPLPVSHNAYYDTAIMSHAHTHKWYTQTWTRNRDVAVYDSMNVQSFAQSSK